MMDYNELFSRVAYHIPNRERERVLPHLITATRSARTN